MSVNLVKGQKVNLSKDASDTKKFLVGLGWDANTNKGFFSSAAYDLDASAFILRDGKLCRKKDIVYFGNLEQSGVWHHGDNLTGKGEGDDEQITVNLKKLDSDIDKIIFVVNIYKAKQRKQSFKNVKNAFIRLVDENSGVELYRYNLSDGSVGDCSSLIFAEIYKHNDEWKFNAIGEGCKAGSITELAELYA